MRKDFCEMLGHICLVLLEITGRRLKIVFRTLRYDNCMLQIQHETDFEIQFNARNDFKYDNMTDQEI